VGVNINRERFNDWGFAGARGFRERLEAGRAAADRAAIDAKTNTVKVEGSGTLTANINAPPGTTATMEGDGLFKKTEVNRSTQMTPASAGPAIGAGSS
jgi:hypothetical protein